MTDSPDTYPPYVSNGPASLVEGRTTDSAGVVEVTVERTADLDEALENAISLVTSVAKRRLIGIMVTREGAGRYVVRAHPEVPYGLIRQRHATGGLDDELP